MYEPNRVYCSKYFCAPASEYYVCELVMATVTKHHNQVAWRTTELYCFSVLQGKYQNSRCASFRGCGSLFHAPSASGGLLATFAASWLIDTSSLSLPLALVLVSIQISPFYKSFWIQNQPNDPTLTWLHL